MLYPVWKPIFKIVFFKTIFCLAKQVTIYKLASLNLDQFNDDYEFGIFLLFAKNKQIKTISSRKGPKQDRLRFSKTIRLPEN